MAHPVSTDNSLQQQQQNLAEGLQKMMLSNPVAAFIMPIVNFLVSLGSLSVEVLFRRKFGENYLTNIAFALSALWFILLAQFAKNIAGSDVNRLEGMSFLLGKPTALTWVFFWGFVLVGIFHRVETFRANWVTGEDLHSFSAGNSWLERFRAVQILQQILYFIPNFTQRWLEPLLVLLLSLVFPDAFMRGWLLLAGACLLMREGLRSAAQRQAFLQLRNARIEAEVMVEVSKILEQSKATGQLPENPIVRMSGYTQLLPIEELIRQRNTKQQKTTNAPQPMNTPKPSSQ